MVYSGWATELDEDQSQLRRMNGYSRRDMETVNNKNAEKNTKQNNYYHATPAPPTSAYSSDFQSCELEFSSPSTHTNTSRPKDMSAAQNGKTGNYHGPTAAHGTSVHPGAFPSGGMGSIANRNTPTGFPARTEYPSTLQSGRTESSSIIPNANTGNSVVNMNAARNGKTKQYHQDTAVPPISRYSKDLQSSELHSRSTPAQPNSMTNANNIDRSKKGGEVSYPRTAATSVIVGYPSSVQPGRIDSSSTLDHTNTAKVNRPTKGKEAATAVARYSDDLYSKEIDSNSTPAYTNTGANANKVSRSKKEKEGNYPSPATMSATAGYPSEFQSGESDWSYTAGNEIHTTNNTNKKNPSKIGKNSKHGTEHSITEAPPCPGYPSTFHGREKDSSSTVTKNSMNKGKNGSYTSTTVGSAGQGYPSTFQSSNIKSSANTSAWEEHIDEHTNRKYFYNCITGRSSWGEPNASVKRAPPPPPSPPPTSLIVEKREQDHWFRTRNSRGTKVWYNDVTNRTQVDRPDCLRKYR